MRVLISYVLKPWFFEIIKLNLRKKECDFHNLKVPKRQVIIFYASDEICQKRKKKYFCQSDDDIKLLSNDEVSVPYLMKSMGKEL